jgi:enterochelin esterase-like enzyme
MAGALTGVGRRWLLVGLATVCWIAAGLVGAYAYGESYYRHRGFSPIPRLPHAGIGRLATVHFYSAALHREADYEVFLPAGYGQTRRRYPVFYLLHGDPGGPANFVDFGDIGTRLDNLISRHLASPMLLVFPDGRIDGSSFSDSEWADSRRGAYGSLVLNVVSSVDHRFATIGTRQARVIGGLSEGAFGATNLALRHLPVFSGLQGWSGYYVAERTGVFARAPKAELAANSPLEYVHTLKAELAPYPLRALLYIGRKQRSRFRTRQMALALVAAGADARYAFYSGGHDWELWDGHMNQMLELASRWFGSRVVPLRSHGESKPPNAARSGKASRRAVGSAR